jgi:hypothetical protein
MADATTSETATRAGRSWGSLVLWGLALVVFYVLSTGPMVKMAESGLFEATYLNKVYAPLGWAVDRSSGVEHFFIWYLGEIWRCDVPGKSG